MKRKEVYDTKQKELILKTIEKQQKEFTIKDLYSELKEEVGLTTIYRLIPKLVEENIINKYTYDNVTYYQKLIKCNEKNHFYLKCEKCRKLIHIDCDCIEELSKHILEKHRFLPNREHIIINGLCEKCSK